MGVRRCGCAGRDGPGELFAHVDLVPAGAGRSSAAVIRAMVNAALSELSGAFGQLYARLGPAVDRRSGVFSIAEKVGNPHPGRCQCANEDHPAVAL